MKHASVLVSTEKDKPSPEDVYEGRASPMSLMHTEHLGSMTLVLDNEMMERLGIDPHSQHAGDMLELCCECKIDRIHHSDGAGGEKTTLHLQVKRCGCPHEEPDEDDEPSDRQARFYGGEA